jgi:hypothetical protein
MSHDRWTRRASALLVCVAFMAVPTGCRRSPFQRLADGTVPDRSPAAVPTQVRQLQPVPEAVSDLQVSAAITAPPPAPASLSQTESFSLTSIHGPQDLLEKVSGPENATRLLKQAATPLLDSALKRAEAQDHVPLETLAASQPASPPLPVGRSTVHAVMPVAKPREPESASQKPSRPSRLAGSRASAASSAAEPKTQAKPPELRDAKEGPKDPTTASSKAEPADPAVIWGNSLERLKRVAQESANQPSSGEGVALWQVRAQVIDWLSSNTARPANHALLKGAVTTIADAIKTPSGDDPARSAEIRSAVLALEDRVPLNITGLRLCRRVYGFGAFEPLEGSGLKAGQTVLIYCEPTGLRYRTKGETFSSRLSSRVELVSAKGGTKVWEQALGEAEDECRSRRRDCYVNYRTTFPPTIAPGDYRLRLIQTDLVANCSASSELPVTFSR